MEDLSLTRSLLSPSEALELSLFLRGRVDLHLICERTGLSSAEVYDKLVGFVYYDPDQDALVSSSEYLSGNVLKKLNHAKKFQQSDREFGAPERGFTVDWNVNINALDKIMPPFVPAEDIKAAIGSPWIPSWVYRDFLIALIGIKPVSGKKPRLIVEYVKAANHYIIHGKKHYMGFTRARLTYGTERMNAFDIMERLLNSGEVVVYDTSYSSGKAAPTRRINRPETLIAQERMRMIEEKFRLWLFRDEPRRSRLLNHYNEAFGAIRPRIYSGKGLVLPGKNPDIKLQDYQLAAVARIVHSKNTLLAHQVGAGKTYAMAAAAMELRRTGISRRNLFVVPNNILDQWHSEFLKLYPEAKLIVIEPKDFTPAKRQAMLSRIAASDVDAIIMGYGSFSLIPLSRRERERELTQRMADISVSMHNAVYNDAYMVLNRYSARLERKLRKLWDDEDPVSEDEICFDDLGIDTLFVDEAHNFKNISIETKHGTLPGLNTKGSKRCDDLLAKVRFIQSTHGGRGAVFATGTPITNSVSDLYTMLLYLAYERLEEMNLVEFDNWVKLFSEVTEEFEVEANGIGYRLRRRLSRYHNLPELSLLLSEIADLHFTRDEEKKLPSNVNYVNCTVPASKALRDYINELADRAETVKAGLVPRTEDNMLKITTDGRKAALDMRLVDPKAEDLPTSKLNTCVEKVFEIWKNDRDATQLVFLDQSTPKDGFNLYDDMKRKLVKKGVPAKEIAFVHDAVNDAMRTALFVKVRRGEVRILIGSTFKLGIGANVQDRLWAVHHLDIPWRPSDVTQREGRMLRQGNRNDEVAIYRYITNGSFDAYSWQLLENKQRFTSQIVSGDHSSRSGDEVDEIVLTYSEVKSLAVGDPLIKRRIELETELQRKGTLRSRIERAKDAAKEQLLQLPGREAALHDSEERFLKDMSTAAENAPASGYAIEIEGELFTRRRDAGERLLELLSENAYVRSPIRIGRFRGFELFITDDPSRLHRVFMLAGAMPMTVEISDSPQGQAQRLDNAVNGIPKKLEDVRRALEQLEADRAALEAEAARPNPYDREIRELTQELRAVSKKLGLDM
ncbi:MAG: DEAD/DEAH box helicase family protein [Clostridia bacterium]|nr:DEAD/DEAH box helicase family protein [Clostridia bacterium]